MRTNKYILLAATLLGLSSCGNKKGDYDALLAPTSFILTPPKITNKTQDIGCCKHIKIFLQKKSKNQVNKIDMTKGNL
jgi:hypothetical protein